MCGRPACYADRVDAPGERPHARPETDSGALLRGRRLGDFVLRERIGEGAFAAVYRCEQPLLGREAVIKVLHQRMRQSDVALQRFLREARLASRLDHPYAAHVYAFGVEPEDGLAWIAMELVHGTSLERWLTERGPLPLDILVGFFEQVAEIVQNAHDHGIVHRDLKPSNVMMIEYAGKIFPKLLDFGIAKLVDGAGQPGPAGPVLPMDDDDAFELGGTLLPIAPESSNVHLTQANATLGSPPYMSPEQWCDPLSVGPRSDLYSLGVMAYEALTGRQPFTGATIAAIGEQHCNAEVPAIGGRLPAALDRVFRRVLAKDLRERPANAIEFAAELRAAAFPRGFRAAMFARGSRAEATLAVHAGPPRALWIALATICAALLGAGSVAMYRAIVPSRGAAAPPTAAADPAPDTAPQAPRQPSTPPVRPARVVVQIESTPSGAEVFRLPSETKVGSTPWRTELPREAGVQVFVLRRAGFVDRQVEVDLQTGGKQTIKLSPRRVHRPAPPAPANSAPARRRGEPVDPFSKRSS